MSRKCLAHFLRVFQGSHKAQGHLLLFQFISYYESSKYRRKEEVALHLMMNCIMVSCGCVNQMLSFDTLHSVSTADTIYKTRIFTPFYCLMSLDC